MALPVVALDLDGVLVNSAVECWKVLTLSSPDLARAELGEVWLSERGRARDVAQFLTLLVALGEGVELPAEGGLPPEASPPDDVVERVDRFYRIRSELRRTESEAWFRLHSPYPGVVEGILELSGRAEVHVATSKDTPSSIALLQRFGYAILPERILGREIANTKPALIRELSRRTGSPVGSIAFLDDHLGNCLATQGAGIPSALAGWGYNSEAERRRARARGVPVLSPRDVPRLPEVGNGSFGGGG